MKLSKHDFTNEDALTLAEVLASVVILTIVLILFSTIFSQSLRTTNKSEAIVDATFLAQIEMENIYALSRNHTFDKLEIEMVDSLEYEADSPEGEWTVFHHEIADGHAKSIAKFKEEGGLIRVIVQIIEDGETTPAVQMENHMNWKVVD